MDCSLHVGGTGVIPLQLCPEWIPDSRLETTHLASCGIPQEGTLSFFRGESVWAARALSQLPEAHPTTHPLSSRRHSIIVNESNGDFTAR